MKGVVEVPDNQVLNERTVPPRNPNAPTTFDAIKNAIETEFRSMPVDVSTKAIIAVDRIEAALGMEFPSDVRAKLEEIFVHGVTPGHIDKAAELIGQHYPGLIA